MNLPVLVPGWPAVPGVRALCSLREGGVSAGSWRSLNLGDHVGDAPAAVAENRARWRLALDGARPVYLSQVHGREVVALGTASVDGLPADACTTDEAGLACTVLVADCLPVLLARTDGSRVGAAHAGWRGLAAGVLEAAVEAMRTGAPDIPLQAWLGPCIGPDAFEVGDEVRHAFVAARPHDAASFTPAATPGKWRADLPALARARLHACGVSGLHGNDGSEAWCTVHEASRFFSHRRDRTSGRFAASIWRG